MICDKSQTVRTCLLSCLFWQNFLYYDIYIPDKNLNIYSTAIKNWHLLKTDRLYIQEHLLTNESVKCRALFKGRIENCLVILNIVSIFLNNTDQPCFCFNKCEKETIYIKNMNLVWKNKKQYYTSTFYNEISTLYIDFQYMYKPCLQVHDFCILAWQIRTCVLIKCLQHVTPFNLETGL